MKEALENIKKHVVSDQSDRQGSVVLALPGAASTYEYEQYIPDAPYHCGNRCNFVHMTFEQNWGGDDMFCNVLTHGNRIWLG